MLSKQPLISPSSTHSGEFSRHKQKKTCSQASCVLLNFLKPNEVLSPEFPQSPLIPCYGLRPRWTHITLPCRRALCYIPRLELLNFGDVIAAFRLHGERRLPRSSEFRGLKPSHPLYCGLVT